MNDALDSHGASALFMMVVLFMIYLSNSGKLKKMKDIIGADSAAIGNITPGAIGPGGTIATGPMQGVIGGAIGGGATKGPTGAIGTPGIKGK